MWPAFEIGSAVNISFEKQIGLIFDMPGISGPPGFITVQYLHALCSAEIGAPVDGEQV